MLREDAEVVTKPRRRWCRVCMWLGAGPLLALLWFAVVGWTIRVTPPQAPAQPVTVLLIRDQLHRGLLLPTPNGGHVEFGFGDWSWYAQGREGFAGGAAAVLWPTPGTLSRRFVLAERPRDVRAALPWAQFEELLVGAAAAERLRQRLQEQFDAGSEWWARRPGLGLEFVPWGRGYWFGDTCADAVADWCVELGCTVRRPWPAFEVEFVATG